MEYRFSLTYITKYLLHKLENLRLGMSYNEEFESKLHKLLEEELKEIKREYYKLFEKEDEQVKKYWSKIERIIREIIFPYYVKIATKQSELESKNYNLWRGGDLISRVVYAIGGLTIGGFLIWAPFIPVWEKSLPFLLMIVAPFFPDFQKWYYIRKYNKKLKKIIDIAKEEEEMLWTYLSQLYPSILPEYKDELGYYLESEKSKIKKKNIKYKRREVE